MSLDGDAAAHEISDPRLSGNPEISVCILVYNHEAFLFETLQSVFAQEIDIPFEVLVGEDQSTDSSLQIALRFLEKYPQCMRIITADRNVGAFANARRLLNAARGKWITSLDGDDFWLPGKLKKQLSFLERNADCHVIYSNALTIDRDGRRIGMFNDVGTRTFDLRALLRRGNFLNSSSILYSSTIKPYLQTMTDELMDYAVHLQIARNWKIAHIGEPLVAYRVGSSGSMVVNANAHVRELYWQAIQSVPRELVSDDDYAHGIADFLRRVFFRAVRTRDMSLYRAWATRVYAASPYGRAHTSVLVLASIIRIACKALWGQRARLMGRSPPRILYRR